MQSLRRALWRGALQQSARIYSPAAAPRTAPHQGTAVSLTMMMQSAGLHGYKYAIDAPKGVKGETWRKKIVKKRKRKVYSPYSIKATRFYSKQRCLAFQKEQAKMEAREREEAAAAAAAKELKAKRMSYNLAPEPNRFVSAIGPVISAEIPEYCKPVVKKIDPWKARWTPPFKKPRQDYQVGRPRPLSKPLAKVVKRDKEVSKANARKKRYDNRFKKQPMRPKQRMEFT